MYLLKHRLLSSTIAGLIVTIVVYMLYYAKIDDRLTLGITLTVFGILDKLLLDFWRVAYLRKNLLENLNWFFKSLETQDKSQPLWDALEYQIKTLYEVESRSYAKKYLNNALAEIYQLRDHVSYIALDTEKTKSLLQLMNFLLRK